MLDFVRKAFRGGLEVILWINLFFLTICGGVVCYYFGALINYRNAGGFAFLGVIIGIIGGLLTDIVGGGFIATILNMDANIEKLLKGNLSTEASDVNITENQVYQPIFSSGNEYIVSANTFFRSNPSFDAKEGKPLISGDKVLLQKISDENQDWLLIQTPDGTKGWCFSGYLKKS